MSQFSVAVAAASPRYNALRHPGGYGLDDNGEGFWPADSFTFVLIRDQALIMLPNQPATPMPFMPTLQDTFYYFRDGAYVPLKTATLAPVLADLVSFQPAAFDFNLASDANSTDDWNA